MTSMICEYLWVFTPISECSDHHFFYESVRVLPGKVSAQRLRIQDQIPQQRSCRQAAAHLSSPVYKFVKARLSLYPWQARRNDKLSADKWPSLHCLSRSCRASHPLVPPG